MAQRRRRNQRGPPRAPPASRSTTCARLGRSCPESLATFNNRLSINRNNAYTQPLAYKELAGGLPNFEIRQCGGGISAALNPETPKDPAFSSRVEGETAEKTEKTALEFYERLRKFAFGDQDNTANAPAPGCAQQAPFEPIYGGGPATAYQHTYEQGK